MNRNVESRFALSPNIEHMSRSKFPRNFSHKTTFNAGELIPISCIEVLPGDTHQIDTSFLIRMQTLLNPIMDNLYMDTYNFFVPCRLVWSHFKQFMGENTDSYWIPQQTYSVPQIKAPSGGWNVGTIADYLGIPTGVDLKNTTVNALPFRAYALIVQEFFRDQNLTQYLNIPTGDSTQTGSNGSSYVNDLANGGKPFVCAKYHDYFTSCLPAPQKGPDVEIGLSSLSGSDVPVFGNGKALALNGGTAAMYGLYATNTAYDGVYLTGPSVQAYNKAAGNLDANTQTSSLSHIALGVPKKSQLTAENYPTTGLVADLSGVSSTALITINQLRQAFQLQKFYERDASSGTRYTELILSHFHVTSPDARLQRPEYLGGNRVRININSVVQTSETGSTPQGTTAAYSVTSDRHSDFTRSFTEHGFILGLAVVRYDHTYQQGIEKMFLRKSRYDYYWPLFANLGNMKVTNAEIYAQGSDAVNASTGNTYDSEVFGYQEAWADYRYAQNRCSGEMRSTYATSLDSWHLGDEYSQLPSLSDAWIREDKTNVDRTLAVTSSVSNQFFGDFYIQDIATRVMPVYSVPGLIDHH